MSDVLPPPPPPRGGDGCWKWGAITCGVGCLLILIIIVAVVFFFARSPRGKRFVKVFESSGVVAREMMEVKRALDKYEHDHKKYPAELKDLVPKYVASAQSLKSSSDPTGPEFTYIRPTESTLPTAPVLQYDIPNPVMATAPPILVRILKNGVMEINGQRYRAGGTGAE